MFKIKAKINKLLKFVTIPKCVTFVHVQAKTETLNDINFQYIQPLEQNNFNNHTCITNGTNWFTLSKDNSLITYNPRIGLIYWNNK